jgi:hypothetical protein
MFRCHADSEGKINYLQSYRNNCDLTYDANCGMSVTTIGHYYEEIKRLLSAEQSNPTVTKADVLETLLQLMGHSEYIGTEKNQLFQLIRPNDEIKKDMGHIKRLHIPFSSDKGEEIPFLFPVNNITEKEKKLNAIQSQSLGQALVAYADFVDFLNSFIIGVSTTSSRPGVLFTIHMKAYARQ